MSEIENDPDIREFILEDAYEGRSVVRVWCDGRDRDPATEEYRPVYSYSIQTPRWSYEGNDIHGGAYEVPDLKKGSQSLFAFLYACQEAKPGGENANLFPPQVRDWAYHFSEEISLFSLTLEEEK